MDVFTLHSDTYKLDELVQDYTSMIWTERYLEPGDFQLTTGDIQATREMLPLNTLISLRDTKEVMIVESHELSEDSKGERTLVVKGRTYDSYLEQRTIVGDREGFPNKGFWRTQKSYTPGTVAALLIWNHVVDNDPIVTGANDNTHSVTYVGDVKDILTNVRVTRTGTQSGSTSKVRAIEPGVLSEKVLDFLARGNCGIRTIRPYGQSAELISFEADGDAVETTNGNVQSRLIFDVYKGKNRSHNQNDFPKVVFSYAQGHVINPKHLWSKADYKNVAYVNTKFGTLKVVAPWLPGWVGIDQARRILYIEAEDKEDGVSEAEYLESVEDKAETELEKHNKWKWFDGEITPLTPQKYGVDYFLGDKVTLKGDYNIKEVVRVIENIRTDDRDGDRNYPTLAPDEEE